MEIETANLEKLERIEIDLSEEIIVQNDKLGINKNVFSYNVLMIKGKQYTKLLKMFKKYRKV